MCVNSLYMNQSIKDFDTVIKSLTWQRKKNVFSQSMKVKNDSIEGN